MARKIYSITVNGNERIRFSADLVEASAPVGLLDLGGGFETWDSTPFQTADGCHRESEIAWLLAHWDGLAGSVGFEEDWDVEEVTNG